MCSATAAVASIVNRMSDPSGAATPDNLAPLRDIVRRFDAGDHAVTLDAYDDACEALVEAGIEPV